MPTACPASTESRKVLRGHLFVSSAQLPTSYQCSGIDLPRGSKYQPASNQRKSGTTFSATILSNVGFQVSCPSEMLPSELGLPVSPAKPAVVNGRSGSPAAFHFGSLYFRNQARQRFETWSMSLPLCGISTTRALRIFSPGRSTDENDGHALSRIR